MPKCKDCTEFDQSDIGNVGTCEQTHEVTHGDATPASCPLPPPDSQPNHDDGLDTWRDE